MLTVHGLMTREHVLVPKVNRQRVRQWDLPVMHKCGESDVADPSAREAVLCDFGFVGIPIPRAAGDDVNETARDRQGLGNSQPS